MKLFYPLSMICALFLMASCSGESAPESTEQVSAPSGDKIYTVAYGEAYIPFEFQDGGSVVGFTPDLINAIAKDQGLKLSFYNTSFTQLNDHLANGEADLAASSITITPERQKNMDFSKPYFESDMLIFTAPNNQSISVLNDLTQNVRVGAIEGSPVAEKLIALRGSSEGLTLLAEIDSLLVKLSNGELDAVVGDSGVMEYFAAQRQSHFRAVIDTSVPAEQFGFAVKKGANAELLQKINTGLQNIRANGTYDKIYQKWFKKTE